MDSVRIQMQAERSASTGGNASASPKGSPSSVPGKFHNLTSFGDAVVQAAGKNKIKMSALTKHDWRKTQYHKVPHLRRPPKPSCCRC